MWWSDNIYYVKLQITKTLKKKLFWLQALYFYEQNYPLAQRIGNFGNKNLEPV